MTKSADRGPSTAPSILPAALLSAVLATLPAACAPEAGPADLVLRDARIVTMDSARPEANAMAISGDTVVALGSGEEMDAYLGPDSRVLDLGGALVVPGFVESHGHFMGLGQAKTQLDLMATRSWSEIVAMVDSAAAEAAPGDWILGRGWHQEKWDEIPDRTVEGFPVHDRLSRAAPENPVFLTHASGHAAVVNRRAMEVAGIDADTPDPEGGEILRDGSGRPTGVLVDAAEGLVTRAISRSREEETEAERERRRRRVALLAARDALAKGVTSFHDQGASFETIEFYRRMAEEGALPIRLYAMVGQGEVSRENAEALAEHRLVDHARGFLTVRSIGEVSADGALGSRSAWMLEPYRDQPGSTGLNVTSMKRIREIAELGLEHGYQIATHAIGDRANREVLDLYAALWDSAGVDGDTLRWRIEHAQHLHPGDIDRFAELGVVASMQAVHACSDAPYVIRRLGPERSRQGAYVWKTLWESGALVTNGTDAPVEDVDPVASFRCTVTREIVGAPGDSSFFAGQSLTRERALRSYTVNGAWSAFQEEELGSLAPGRYADVVVLGRDIMEVPEDSIPGAQVLYTVVGGKVMYSREAGFRGPASGLP